MNPSSNLFIVGPTGAGKTSIGRRLAAHYGLPFVDLDAEIEEQTGAPVSAVFELEGEAGFRRRESALLDECSRRERVVLATGAGAVLDPCNRRWLAERGYVLWLQASVEQQLARLARDATRPLLAGAGDRRARLQAMAELREPLYREVADLAVPEDHGLAAAGERSILLLERHWQRQQAA